ncbi:MAG TPA: DUF5698 domain-containing protein [Myxococcota bacterium]|nr:DUF5698 domain-containing protein [Myxococcota bacterium]
MSTGVALTFVIIVLARIVDVSMDTMRTVAIVQGRRLFAAVLGFVQAVIFISVVAKVLLSVDHLAYVPAYGLGFALGTYFGIAIEERLAFGQQMALLFTRKGAELAKALIGIGYRVAQVHAHVEGGEMTILYVESPRKRTRRLIRDVGAIDQGCFFVVNDVRASTFVASRDRVDSPRTSG